MSGKTPSEELLKTVERIKNLARESSKDQQIENQAIIISTLAEKNSKLLSVIEEQKKSVEEITKELNQDFQLLKDKFITDENLEKLKKQLQAKFSSLTSEISKLKAEIKSYEALDLKVKSTNISNLEYWFNYYKKSYEEASSKVKELEKKVKELEEKNKELEKKNNPINSIKEAWEAVEKLNWYFTPKERKEIEENKLKLVSQEKRIQELEAKLAEKDTIILTEKEATRQANEKHKSSLKEINVLKSEREEFVGIIKILSQNSQISLENLKLALSWMKKEKWKKFTAEEITKILKTYKQHQ